MEIKKETEVCSSGVPTAIQLEAIHAQTKGKLTAEQLYVFALRLCDDILIDSGILYRLCMDTDCHKKYR